MKVGASKRTLHGSWELSFAENKRRKERRKEIKQIRAKTVKANVAIYRNVCTFHKKEGLRPFER